jgi:beta-lactamase class A
MRFVVCVAFLLLGALLSSCGRDAASEPSPADSIATSGIDVTPLDTTLFDSLRAIEAQSGGELGFAAIHIESGWRTVFGAKETFPMASVAKLPMAIAFLRAVDSGRIRLDTVVRMTRADHRPGFSRVYHRTMKDSAGAVSVHALLDAMLTESDNTASDYVLRLAGGPAVADDLMRRFGLEQIDVTSYEGELILKWAGVDPMTSDSVWTRDRIYAHIEKAGKAAWELAQARLVDDPEDASPPEPLARLLVAVADGRILSKRMTDTVLAIMSRAVTGKRRIPAMLPGGTPVAHKTGTIGSVANDVGIVTLPGGRGRLAIVALVKASKRGMAARDKAIAAATKLAYDAVMAR